MDSMEINRRLPPGQRLAKKLPVLHAGKIPDIDLTDWKFNADGLVENSLSLNFGQIQNLPRTKITCDIHCVTRWSLLDTHWEGVPVKEILDMARPKANAFYALIHGENNFTANLPLDLLYEKNVIFAFKYEDKPLAPEHGWPLRLIAPQRYFWKSAKWVNGIELIEHDTPGYWEKHGYHMEGDPWKEERYGSPRPW